MSIQTDEVQQALEQLAATLDEGAPGQAGDAEQPGGANSSRRDRDRRSLRTGCQVCCFATQHEIHRINGRTRNISANGLGVLLKRPIPQGHPVEIVIEFNDRAPLYLAGTVAFCRYAGRGYHEMGVQVRAAGPHPLISGSRSFALHEYHWFAEAFRLIQLL